jgi:hypothetical protein
MSTKTLTSNVWEITSAHGAGPTFCHGFSFRTKKAAEKVFDKVVIESPRGTKVMLTNYITTTTTTVEKKRKMVSITV